MFIGLTASNIYLRNNQWIILAVRYLWSYSFNILIFLYIQWQATDMLKIVLDWCMKKKRWRKFGVQVYSIFTNLQLLIEFRFWELMALFWFSECKGLFNLCKTFDPRKFFAVSMSSVEILALNIDYCFISTHAVNYLRLYDCCVSFIAQYRQGMFTSMLLIFLMKVIVGLFSRRRKSNDFILLKTKEIWTMCFLIYFTIIYELLHASFMCHKVSHILVEVPNRSTTIFLMLRRSQCS